jgi:lipid-A-disaccharide synthase
MECAYFGVPTIAFYKASLSTYLIGRWIIRVNFLAMPNLLAGRELYPELIQHAANPDSLAHEALKLLRDAPRREQIRADLATVMKSLGGPGAISQAAKAVLETIGLSAAQKQEVFAR